MNRSIIFPLLDIIILAFFAVYIALVLLLPHVNPPDEDGDPPPGQLVIEIRWPDGWNTDVDLWVKAPGEKPVGYSNKNEPVFNLLRDDLGNRSDMLSLNFENSYSRGIPNGEYAATVHLYSNSYGKYPVPVAWQVWYRDERGNNHTIGSGSIELFTRGQERTLLVFEMQDSSFVYGSNHNMELSLREPT
jgi:hypothetical protein